MVDRAEKYVNANSVRDALQWQHLTAGALARGTAAIVMSPFDVIKTRLQIQGHYTRQVAAAASGVGASVAPASQLQMRTYNSGLHALRTILQEEGMGALYSGLTPRLLYVAPAAAISFTCYEMFRSAFHQWEMDRVLGAKRHATSDPDQQAHQSAKLDHHAASPLFYSFALPVALWIGLRITGTALRTPFDILKQRLQAQGALRPSAPSTSTGLHSNAVPAAAGTASSHQALHTTNTNTTRRPGMVNIMRTTVTQQGARGLFSGYIATLLRDIPFAALYFGTYEGTKRLQTRLLFADEAAANGSLAAADREADTLQRNHDNSKRLHFWNHMIAGGLAGTVASILTIPADVVKSRLQTTGKTAEAHLLRQPGMRGSEGYRGIRDAFTRIYALEGMAGLLSGLGPRLLYIIPASSLTFACYEVRRQCCSMNALSPVLIYGAVCAMLICRRTNRCWSSTFPPPPLHQWMRIDGSTAAASLYTDAFAC